MKLCEWIKLRKQSDMVKLAVIFLALGIVFLMFAVFQGIKFADVRNKSTEYILSHAGNIEEKEIDAISALANVSSVSRELEEQVTIKYKDKQTEASCIVLDREYIEHLYGISCAGNTRTFYINNTALEMLNRELFLYDSHFADGEAAELSDKTFPVSVIREEAGEQAKKARLVVVKDTAHEQEPFLCTYEEELTLQHKAVSLRVLLEKRTLDGTEKSRFEKLGFSVQNGEKIAAWEYTIKEWMLRMKYDILIAVLCLAAGGALLKCGKQIWKNQTKNNSRTDCIKKNTKK